MAYAVHRPSARTGVGPVTVYRAISKLEQPLLQSPKRFGNHPPRPGTQGPLRTWPGWVITEPFRRLQERLLELGDRAIYGDRTHARPSAWSVHCIGHRWQILPEVMRSLHVSGPTICAESS